MDLTEIIINISATVIALAALGLSIYEGRLARQHNRLSVRPLLDSTRRESPAFERYSLTVVNNGLGPAMIQKWELLLDGKPYQDHGISQWEQLTENLKLPSPVNYGYFKPNSVLASGESEELIGYPVGVYSPEASHQFREVLKRLTIRIKYESMYHEPFTFEFCGTEPQSAKKA